MSNIFVVKWHEVTQTLSYIDDVNGMTSEKSCNYSKHGSFKNLLFVDHYKILKKSMIETIYFVHAKLIVITILKSNGC